MSRRADPKRIDAAQEAGTRRRLVLSGMTEATADALLNRWHEKATEDGLERGSAYWDAAWAWIAAERVRRVKP
jgi:hypothetical protein